MQSSLTFLSGKKLSILIHRPSRRDEDHQDVHERSNRSNAWRKERRDWESDNEDDDIEIEITSSDAEDEIAESKTEQYVVDNLCKKSTDIPYIECEVSTVQQSMVPPPHSIKAILLRVTNTS